MDPLTRSQILRSALLVPCETKADLHQWIQQYLDIDLPDCTVDPESTSNPMDLIWEIYSRMRAQDESLSRILAYAAREAFKTLGSAVLELLVILHMERDVGHMAAIEFQAKNAQRYFKGFCKRPFIRDFVTTDNERTIEFTRYKGPGGMVLSPVEYGRLPPTEQANYSEVANRMTIIVATMNQTNSLHVPFFVQDELDLAPPAPLEEAKMIPTQGRNGEPSVTYMTSSRKFSFGPVQAEIDKAEEEVAQTGHTDLQIRHWNIIDVTQPCPSKRHLPDEPKQVYYVNDDDLKAIKTEDFAFLSEEERKKYKQVEGYAGCLRNCRMFSACKGLLATQQKSTSKLLKRVNETQVKFRAVDIDVAKAQLLCRKPSTEGLIYGRFDKKVHLLSPAEMAAKLTGDSHPADLTKSQLITLMKARGVQWYAGIDHGFTHNFAVVTGGLDGNRMFIVDVIAEPGLEAAEKHDRCKERYAALGFYPEGVWADTEDPASNKTLRKLLKLREWSKKPNSVVDGIQTVRTKLNPTLGQEPELFFLKGDEGVAFLVKQLEKYHWKLDAMERATQDPDKVDDDTCDALRYLVMNLFGRQGGLLVAPGILQQPKSEQQKILNHPHNWMQEKIKELTGGQSASQDGGGITVKSGRFFFGV